MQTIVFWLFGSLLRATPAKVAVVGGVLAVALPLLLRDAWRFTALQLGVDRARGLGVPVDRLRLRAFVAVSLLTGAAVAFVGTIGFVGLVAPRVARLLVVRTSAICCPPPRCWARSCCRRPRSPAS